jgi:hypothetical protein
LAVAVEVFGAARDLAVSRFRAIARAVAVEVLRLADDLPLAS